MEFELNGIKVDTKDLNPVIEHRNPFTGNWLKCDLREVDNDYVGSIMEQNIREELHAHLAPCEGWLFLAAWATITPQDEIDKILGS